MGGLMALCGFQEDPPNHPGGLQGYHMASIAASTGITLALYARDVDPQRRGMYLDISMQEAVSMSTLQHANGNRYTVHGETPARVDLDSGGGSIIKCRDGRWISFVIPPPFWDNFVVWLLEHDLAGELINPEWADDGARMKNPVPVTEAIRKLALLYDRDKFFHEAQKRRLLGMPVNTVKDLYDDEQLNSRGYFVKVEHDDLHESLTYPGAPMVLSETPYELAGAAPRLGQHNEEVFVHELDLSEKEMKELRSLGVI
jgi:crotonobetainyl-CoA:carnitine CoA-transferase CaiB-like acyl-CoA transferase